MNQSFMGAGTSTPLFCESLINSSHLRRGPDPPTAFPDRKIRDISIARQAHRAIFDRAPRGAVCPTRRVRTSLKRGWYATPPIVGPVGCHLLQPVYPLGRLHGTR